MVVDFRAYTLKIGTVQAFVEMFQGSSPSSAFSATSWACTAPKSATSIRS